MNTVLDDKQMKSLALGIARGRSVWSWARRHAVDFTTAYDWSIQNENRELVDVARMRIADRLVGRLVGAAKLAIDQLVRLCTRSASDTVRLSASRALLHWWFKASELFDMYGKLRDMEKRVTKVVNQKKSGEWRPVPPYMPVGGRGSGR